MMAIMNLITQTIQRRERERMYAPGTIGITIGNQTEPGAEVRQDGGGLREQQVAVVHCNNWG